MKGWKMFLIYSDFKAATLQQSKELQSSNLGNYVKGVSFDKRYTSTKGVPFPSKMVYKRVRGWTLGWNLPV